jgi:hypothetical protein
LKTCSIIEGKERRKTETFANAIASHPAIQNISENHNVCITISRKHSLEFEKVIKLVADEKQYACLKI